MNNMISLFICAD